MKVKEHYHIAELLGGVVTPGHFYCYKNDAAHYNHVHVAYLPWQEPDAPNAKPPNNCPTSTAASKAFRAAVTAKFGSRYRWNGGCVYKHRNSDPAQPWSQHAINGNADDFMANGHDQDALINWLESEWKPKPEEDDAMLDPNWSKGYSEAWDDLVAGNITVDYYIDRKVGEMTDDAQRARNIGRRQACVDYAATPTKRLGV